MLTCNRLHTSSPQVGNHKGWIPLALSSVHLLAPIQSRGPENSCTPNKGIKWPAYLLHILEICRRLDTVTEDFRGFSQIIQAKARLMPQTVPWPLPFISFLIHYSSIIVAYIPVLGNESTRNNRGTFGSSVFCDPRLSRCYATAR
jgi:hypothetical protein